MIEKVMNASMELFDETELYSTDQDNTKVLYGNGQLKIISSNRTSGVMMRVKKQGMLGIASATNLEDPQVFLQQAGQSSDLGAEVPYSFSVATEFPALDVHSPEVADFPTDKMIEMCEQAKEDILKEFPNLSINLSVEKELETTEIATSGGTRAVHSETGFSFVISAPIKGAGTSVYRYRNELAPFQYPKDTVSEFINFYRWTETTRVPSTGKMPVIWAPQAMGMFALSFCAGISGEELVKKTSPLMESFDKQIFSDKITLLDDPHSPRPGARAFDDEGVPTIKRALVEKGVLKSYLLDLRTGAKLSARSSGNGFKKALFAGGYTMMPNPWPANLWLEPGSSSLEEMISSIDEGILLTGGMGFHSGNYSQGDVSVQANGYMIEKGKVTGRLDSTMVSTNIYQDFKHVGAISAKTEISQLGYYPYVLIESMQVVGK